MTEAKTIYELFAEVKREVGPVGKKGVNEKQHYNFRGIDAVVNAAAPALDKHGVLTIPVLQALEYSIVEVGSNRTQMGHVRVTVTYRFTGPAGDSFDATVPGEAMDSGDKATAKAMSVAYRTALLQALNLPTGDADPDSQSYERSPARPQSAGEAFANAAPVQDMPDVSEWDPGAAEAAQGIADEAAEARTVSDVSALHAKSHDLGLLGTVIKNPATGGKGPLGKYLTWRRSQLSSEARALAELRKAGEAAGLEGEVLDERVKELTGAGIETATVAQMKEAAAKLAGAAS
jgi:ERF superfamily